MKGIIKKIDQINFGLMSPEQIREMSVVKIERPDTYDEDGYPIEPSLLWSWVLTITTEIDSVKP